MYAAKVVERAPAEELLARPLHPYTAGLLASVPGLGANRGKRRLPALAGRVPDLAQPPTGCRFRDRCPEAVATCSAHEPELRSLPGRRHVACHVAWERARARP